MALRNARRFYSVSVQAVPILRRQADKIAPQVNVDCQDPRLLEEAAWIAGMDIKEIKLVRPMKLIYVPTEEVPILYNSGPKDSLGRVWCDSFTDILKSLGTEKKDVAWQVCDASMSSALELIGSISHIEPGTKVVSNQGQTRQYVIVDLRQKHEMCEKLNLLPSDRLATGLGLCTVPLKALELGALQPIEREDGGIDLRIDELKFIVQSVDRHLRHQQLGLDTWVKMKTQAGGLTIRECVTVDLSMLGASSNISLFWPKRDFKLLSLMQRLLRDISIRTRGCTAEWGPFEASNIREVKIVPREDITELERSRFVEPQWLKSTEIVPRCPSEPPRVVRRTLRIRRPHAGNGLRPRPRYWYKLLQLKGPDMKDSDGGRHGFRHVPIEMAMRRKLNRAQRIKFGFEKKRVESRRG